MYVVTPCSPPQTLLQSPDSNRIVSCPSLSGSACPLIFHHGNMLPDGDECVLLSITDTSVSSAAAAAKERIKHGLRLNGDLMSYGMT